MKISASAIALLLVVIAGCASNEPIGPDGDIDFQGTWRGDIGDPNLITRTGITWTPTHSRSTVSGPIEFQLTPTLTATGTLTGTVEGQFIHFTLTVPAGAYPAPVSQSCTLTGAGDSSVAAEASIVAMLALTYTAPCLGSVSSAANVDHRITLTKIE